MEMTSLVETEFWLWCFAEVEQTDPIVCDKIDFAARLTKNADSLARCPMKFLILIVILFVAFLLVRRTTR